MVFLIDVAYQLQVYKCLLNGYMHYRQKKGNVLLMTIML